MAIQFITSEIARSMVLELARLNNNRAGGPLCNSGSRSRTHTKFVDGEVGQRVAGTASYRRRLRSDLMYCDIGLEQGSQIWFLLRDFSVVISSCPA